MRRVIKDVQLLSWSVIPKDNAVDKHARIIRCQHCSVIIPDINRGWNRAGKHWCSKLCYEEDHGYANQAKPKPAKMKKI